jgi:hypothetical protein
MGQELEEPIWINEINSVFFLLQRCMPSELEQIEQQA